MSFEFLKSDFAADAVMSNLRARFVPECADVVVLDRMPLVDLLRRRVVSSDIPWLLEILESGPDANAGLAVSLLRLQMRASGVRGVMEAAWPTASPYLKNRLMWRLLDCEDLDQSWHAEFRSFVFAEWNVFQDFNRNFYGPAEMAISSLLSRLGDPSFPNSKKWVYLCSASAVVKDSETLRSILRLGLLLPDQSAQEVARILLDGPPSQDLGLQVSALTDVVDAPKRLKFIATAILSQLRSGEVPAEAEADRLNRLPMIDVLREQVTEQDIPWVLETLENQNGEAGGLLLSLLRKFTDRQDIQIRLRSKWGEADAFLRAHLMWRILDDPKLPAEWHKELFEFVLSEWTIFQQVSLKFIGTPQTVVLQALKRIGDPSFPESKKWAYFCRVPEVAEDQEAARALVSLGLQMENQFTRCVAERLLLRFFPDANALHGTFSVGQTS